LQRFGGSKMLRQDLAAAGIPYRDASGQVFDFHALRGMTATLLDSIGTTPRVVQRIMRHSTLELTNRYTRPRALDIELAARSLPSLKPNLVLAQNDVDAPIDDNVINRCTPSVRSSAPIGPAKLAAPSAAVEMPYLDTANVPKTAQNGSVRAVEPGQRIHGFRLQNKADRRFWRRFRRYCQTSRYSMEIV
jgi:hypothetical protein